MDSLKVKSKSKKMKKLFNLCLVLLFSVSLGFAMSDNVPDTHKEKVISVEQMECDAIVDYSVTNVDANTNFTFIPNNVFETSEADVISLHFENLEVNLESPTLFNSMYGDKLINWPRYWHNRYLKTFYFHNYTFITSSLSNHLSIGLVEKKANAPNGAPPSFFNSKYFRHFPLC